MHIYFYSKKTFYRKNNKMIYMNRNKICNKVKSFKIITCPICGFTFRRARKEKISCPMCGTWLFGFDFNKFIDKTKFFHNVR